MAAIPEILPPERKEAPQPKRGPIIIEGKIEGNGEPAQTLKGITPITRQDRLLPAQASPSSNGQEANQEAGLVHVPRKPATYIGAGLALAAAKTQDTQSNAMVVDKALNGEYLQETGLAVVSKNTGLQKVEKKTAEPPPKTASELVTQEEKYVKDVPDPKQRQQRSQGSTNNHKHDFHHAVDDSHNFAAKHTDHATTAAGTYFNNAGTMIGNGANVVLDRIGAYKQNEETAAYKEKLNAKELAGLQRENDRDATLRQMAASMAFLSSLGGNGRPAGPTQQHARV